MLDEIYSGLIISPALSALPSTNSDLIHQLLKRQLPVVFIGSAPTGIYNATVVSLDNYDKGYQMARRFINSGHKSLGGINIRLRLSGQVQLFQDILMLLEMLAFPSVIPAFFGAIQ